jgi:hypothetical protein
MVLGALCLPPAWVAPAIVDKSERTDVFAWLDNAALVMNVNMVLDHCMISFLGSQYPDDSLLSHSSIGLTQDIPHPPQQ